MKFTIALVLTLTAALLQLGCAYPQASVQQVPNEGNLFNEIFQGFGDLAKDFVERFQNASQSGAETAQHFLENLANAAQQFIKEAEQLEQNALTVREHISEAIIEQEQSILRGWNVWSAEQLENVAVLTDGDDEAINQARELINEFINRYGNFLSSCADEQEFELQDFESRLLVTIARYQNVLQQIITQVELCLNGDDSSSASLQCRRNVENVLHGFVKAPADFAKLIKESAKLLSTDYSRRYCVVNTLVEFKVKSYSVQRQLNTIIVETNERKAESDDVSESDNNVNNDIEVDSQSDSESERDSNSEIDSESASDSESANDSNSESANDSNSESDSQSDNQSDNLSDSQDDNQSGGNSGSSNDNESDNEVIGSGNDSQSDSNNSDAVSDDSSGVDAVDSN